ncbi:SET domain-containing protein [Mycena olivaceomarginata]|nr:SET domain-containing protein [Mycena olivaceomarginata]
MRILRECRAIVQQDSFDAALEAPKVSFVVATADVITSPDRPDINTPLVICETTREPDFATRMEVGPPTVLQTRRELIQNEWNKVARQAGAAGIEFINDVDDEEVPPGIGVLFPYVERRYLFDIGIAEPSPLLGCGCNGMVGCEDSDQCSCQAAHEHRPAYTQGLFTFNTELEIIECNNCCGCPRECPNRVVQFPRQIPVQIFKAGRRGWGARVPVELIKGQVVGLYTGLLIRRDEASRLSGSRASYCFDLDVNEDPDEEPSENVYSVDAYACGNWTRFLNHSCSPNLQIISVVYETMPEDNMPYLAFVAMQDIPAYVELTFDYNPAHQAEWDSRKYQEKSQSKKNKIKNGRTPCLCGASQCRGWLPVAA